MKKIITFFMFGALCALVLSNCVTNKRIYNNGKDLEQLISYMSGAFNSSNQAQRDTDYYDITLHMQPIWKNKSNNLNGHWLYVEQAVSANLQKPYRQRIYRVEQLNKNTFRSHVYLIKEEKKFIGAWQKPEMFETITEKDLELKDGCAVTLHLNANGIYSGSTDANGCESNLRGASYATSKVTITNKGIESWDQGFDNAGKQVWGATKGAYQFIKQ